MSENVHIPKQTKQKKNTHNNKADTPQNTTQSYIEVGVVKAILFFFFLAIASFLLM